MCHVWTTPGWQEESSRCGLVGALAPLRSILTFLLLGRRHPFEHQLLHSSRSLREIDIAFGIDRHVIARSWDAGRLDRAYAIECLAINDGNVFVGADVEELLLRVGGQRQIPCKRRPGPDQLLYELAVVGEHLDAPVLPIG